MSLAFWSTAVAATAFWIWAVSVFNVHPYLATFWWAVAVLLIGMADIWIDERRR